MKRANFNCGERAASLYPGLGLPHELPLMTSADDSAHQDVRPKNSIIVRWPPDGILMTMSCCPIVQKWVFV